VSEPAVVVRDLRFSYNRSKRVILDGIDLEIPAGTRCLVIGANGAGKTTMLRVIAGKHMVSRETVRVLGASAFHDTWLAGDVEMLGGNWPFDIDLEVDEMLRNAVGIDPVRRDHLVELLGVDRTWHMHAVSDGQRRRVQLLFGLMRPRKLLLLDEVTTDLDLLARQDLLSFLREESEERGATILYATHIFDTLDEWATHVVYLVAGKVRLFSPLSEIPELAEWRAKTTTPLLHLVEAWLRRDTRSAI
jgi:CCR4-NOT complex subunit CAF16